MHKSTFLRMQYFVEHYLSSVKHSLKVLDVGSCDVNGSYRPLFQDKRFVYTGLDMASGKNVDLVPKHAYAWEEIADASFDVVISGQVLEHAEFFWITVAEMARVLKEGGYLCLIVPRGFERHRYPVDCYRFDADGMIAIARYLNLEVLHASSNMAPKGANLSDWCVPGYEDSFLIARKPKGWKGGGNVSDYRFVEPDLTAVQKGFIESPYTTAQLNSDAALGRALRERYLNVQFFWEEGFYAYAREHDLSFLSSELKRGLDAVSVTYIDRFLTLLELCKIKQHILVHRDFAWTDRDRAYVKRAREYIQSTPWPYSEFGANVKFVFANLYGLNDLPRESLDRVNGKAVIDGGAYIGDTALLFYLLFKESRIYAFEPMERNFEVMQKLIEKYRTTDRIQPLCAGLSDKSGSAALSARQDTVLDAGASIGNDIQDGASRKASVIRLTAIDELAKKESLQVGLIKLDVEGWEMAAVEGARETIMTQKPLIAAAIYHSPEEFFTLKSKLLELNPDYHFMVRRSEMVLPTADLILIAY